MSGVPRGEALDRWWAALDDSDRRAARNQALEADNLSERLAVGLVSAGVLVVSEGSFTNHSPDSAGFPMPADVCAYIIGRAAA